MCRWKAQRVGGHGGWRVQRMESREGRGQGGRRAPRVKWELASVSAVLRESSRSEQGLWRPHKASESCLFFFFTSSLQSSFVLRGNRGKLQRWYGVSGSSLLGSPMFAPTSLLVMCTAVCTPDFICISPAAPPGLNPGCDIAPSPWSPRLNDGFSDSTF